MIITINKNISVEVSLQAMFDFFLAIEVAEDELSEKYAITAYLPYLNEISVVTSAFGYIELTFLDGKTLEMFCATSITNKLQKVFEV